MMKSLHVTQLIDEGKRLITVMESPHPSLKENPEFQSSLAYVRHLLKNVTEVRVKLDLLWTIRCSRLTENFRVRRFEEEAKMVSWFVWKPISFLFSMCVCVCVSMCVHVECTVVITFSCYSSKLCQCPLLLPPSSIFPDDQLVYHIC